MAIKAKMGKVTGLSSTIMSINEFKLRLRAELQDAVVDTAERVRTVAIRSIQKGPKTGREYVRGTVTHRASAPGEPPATDTGDLVSSIHRVDGELEAAVGSGLDKAPHLEFGTSQMKARPWLFPALESQRAYYNNRVNAAVQNAANSIKDKFK